MTALAVKGLRKRYGSFEAVRGISFKVEKGEIFGLIGPNGAGKTTTIKLIVGLLRPDGGEVKLLGREMPNKDVLRRVGYMPQELALYMNLTVEENLEFYSRLYGLSKREFNQRKDWTLKFVGLDKFKDRIVRELSGGMQRRVSLACALIHEPEFLILDEPTVGVDPNLRANFWGYFRQLTESGASILITTHYMDEAVNCDRIAVMMKGKIVTIASPQEIMEKTESRTLEEAILKLTRW
ncbi:ABC transporter ATP-binding protein [Thermococcus chitonophagus]|uniref:ABC transporter ATP-binding protein n=1 Tax=Thermococcus chitonophagus TaxID=54262 RepID=A0A170S8R2_9EURY|nr:ABC transporter ATP-binding protein [Thermococcus chitonophagus]ASJ15582.1 ABC transporter ATP-binding protein [Thermococcus chitonophagus]CUX76788.1 daunorubicin resistance ATP-binding protein [Thermococcus chitonophagus]